MRIDQSSMDISTLIEKIRRQEIDLQPDFQRGQVWSDSKKRRLIDTILRQWYIPAIHIVVNDEMDSEEVLDGQQRLRAIMAFLDGEFSVDGDVAPDDPEIKKLDGLYFDNLPDRIRSRFKRFPITTIRLRDYSPDEPGELFFRLNQITALTAAEQRNALIGAPRNQVRELVELLERNLGDASLGFSNARMNLDDSLSRLVLTLEAGKLEAKIGAATLERRYRSDAPFGGRVMESARMGVLTLAKLIRDLGSPVRLNKASLFSWIYFITDHDFGHSAALNTHFVRFFFNFESLRSAARSGSDIPIIDPPMRHALDNALAIFNDRSSSRVNDVASILLRDLALAVALELLTSPGAFASPLLSARRHAVRKALDRLTVFPTDIADRSLAESALARQWEAERAVG